MKEMRDTGSVLKKKKDKVFRFVGRKEIRKSI